MRTAKRFGWKPQLKDARDDATEWELENVTLTEERNRFANDLLAASLENKRLRDALEIASDGFEAAYDRFLAQGQEGPAILAKTNKATMKEATSSPDHSALAGLYLELLQEVKDITDWRQEKYNYLRDILKRIKEQG